MEVEGGDVGELHVEDGLAHSEGVVLQGVDFYEEFGGDCHSEIIDEMTFQ